MKMAPGKVFYSDLLWTFYHEISDQEFPFGASVAHKSSKINVPYTQDAMLQQQANMCHVVVSSRNRWSLQAGNYITTQPTCG